MHVLADPHAPENERGFRRSVKPRHLLQRFCGDATHRCHLLRREILDALLQRFETLRIAGDILLVGQPLADDGVQHGIQHGHIAAGLELQVMAGMARQCLPARVHDNELRAALGRLLDEGRRHRMIDRRVGADDDDDLSLHRRREWC